MQITREMVQHPVASQQFADLMRRMQVSDYDLYGIASSCVDTTEAKGSASVVGSAIDADDLLGDIFGDAAATQAPEEEQGIEEASPAPAVGRDQISIFCERAMTHWYEKLEDVGRSAVLCRLYALQAKTLEFVRAEDGAERNGPAVDVHDDAGFHVAPVDAGDRA